MRQESGLSVEKWPNSVQKSGHLSCKLTGGLVEIVDGYIYHDWDVVMGIRKGKHTVEV